MSSDEKNNKNNFLNKRQYGRVDLDDPIRLVKGVNTYDEFLGDISKTGCKVFSLDELKSGEEVQVGIKDPRYGEYFNIKGIVRRSIVVKEDESLNLGGSIYKCFTCKYTAQKIKIDGGIKWQTIKATESHKDGFPMPTFDYFQKADEEEMVVCPVCFSDSYIASEGRFYQLGIEFVELDKDLNQKIEAVISHAVSLKSSGKRSDSRVDGQFLPVNLEQNFESGVDLYNAYLMDFSRGGARVVLEKEYKIGQEINLKLGLKDKQSFEIPAQIVHRRKTNNGTEYGLKFKFFDKGIQAELNHFIDGLAKGEYQAHEESQQQKKLVLSSGAWGLGGFAGGFAAALILLGGFYILSGYKFSKKDQVIIVDASKKGIKSHDLFKSKTKGFPEKLKSQIANVLQVCQDVKGNVNKECLEKGLSEFSSKVSGAKQDIKRLEEKILNKGKKISKQEMHAFYLTLQKQKGLSDSQKRVELEHFQLKVKRAIQIPTKANKSKKKQGATQ